MKTVKQKTNYSKITSQNLSSVHESLKSHLGYLLHKSTLLFKLESSERLASLGIQSCHFAALLIIDTEQSTNQIQICSETGVDKATMVSTIDHLENLKLIERVVSKNDRRVKILNLTKKGKNILKKAKAIRAEYEKDYLSSLNKQEAESLKIFLLKLIER